MYLFFTFQYLSVLAEIVCRWCVSKYPLSGVQVGLCSGRIRLPCPRLDELFRIFLKDVWGYVPPKHSFHVITDLNEPILWSERKNELKIL